MKEQFEVLSENAGEVIHLLEQLTAAMDNALLHLGHHMTTSDAIARRQLVTQAEALLKKLENA